MRCLPGPVFAVVKKRAAIVPRLVLWPTSLKSRIALEALARGRACAVTARRLMQNRKHYRENGAVNDKKRRLATEEINSTGAFHSTCLQPFRLTRKQTWSYGRQWAIMGELAAHKMVKLYDICLSPPDKPRPIRHPLEHFKVLKAIGLELLISYAR